MQWTTMKTPATSWYLESWQAGNYHSREPKTFFLHEICRLTKLVKMIPFSMEPVWITPRTDLEFEKISKLQWSVECPMLPAESISQKKQLKKCLFQRRSVCKPKTRCPQARSRKVNRAASLRGLVHIGPRRRNENADRATRNTEKWLARPDEKKDKERLRKHAGRALRSPKRFLNNYTP